MDRWPTSTQKGAVARFVFSAGVRYGSVGRSCVSGGELRRVSEFATVKVISDEYDFSFPSMERFVDSGGQFREGRFAVFAALRPWLWPQVARLARNSNRASRALCDWLGKLDGADQRL